jgi:hypothetical protein
MRCQEGLPDWARLPVARESHFEDQGGIEAAEQADQTLGPVGARLDAGDEMQQEDEAVVDLALCFGQERIEMKIRPEVGRLFARELELEDKGPVPEAGMVGGAVSQHAEVMHQGAESLLIHAKGIGDGLADGGLAQLAQQVRYVPKRGHFHDDPGRWPGHEQRAPMVLDEVFPAPLHLIMQFGERARMDERCGEVRVVQIPQRPQPMPDFVGPARTKGDLHAFAGFDDQVPQTAIKGIERPELFKGCAGQKGISIPWQGEREAVGRDAIVIVMRQTVQSGGLVGDHQSSCLQKVELLLVVFSGLAHG